MTTGDVVYSLRFSLIKILPEPGFDLGSTAGESCKLTARLHMLCILGLIDDMEEDIPIKMPLHYVRAFFMLANLINFQTLPHIY